MPFLDPLPSHAFLLCFPSPMTMSLHYSTTTTARERDGTTPSYPQGHERAAVNLQDWKVFQKETNRHLRAPAHAGELRDVGSIPGSGRSPGGGHGNPLWYSSLENPMDRGT